MKLRKLIPWMAQNRCSFVHSQWQRTRYARIALQCPDTMDQPRRDGRPAPQKRKGDFSVLKNEFLGYVSLTSSILPLCVSLCHCNAFEKKSDILEKAAEITCSVAKIVSDKHLLSLISRIWRFIPGKHRCLSAGFAEGIIEGIKLCQTDYKNSPEA